MSWHLKTPPVTPLSWERERLFNLRLESSISRVAVGVLAIWLNPGGGPHWLLNVLDEKNDWELNFGSASLSLCFLGDE